MILKEYKNKTVLKGMNMDEMKQWCRDEEYPLFRANQIYQWLYQHGIDNTADMKNLSKDLRSKLNQEIILSTLDTAIANPIKI